MSATNEAAKAFRALHKPGSPLVLANVYDGITARTIAQLPTAKALATASYAVAAAAGLEDKDLDIETNLRAASIIAVIAKEFNKPLTVDFQGGYRDRLEEGIERLVQLGVVGINLEDVDSATEELYSVEEGAARVKRAIKAAADHGVPDFVVNARTDILLNGGTIEDAIERGKAYLAAGATTIFVWPGGAREFTAAELGQLSKALDGRLNLGAKLTPKQLTISEASQIGVARFSIGPQLQFVGIDAIATAAKSYLSETSVST